MIRIIAVFLGLIAATAVGLFFALNYPLECMAVVFCIGVLAGLLALSIWLVATWDAIGAK